MPAWVHSRPANCRRGALRAARRNAIAALEVVVATGITLPAVAYLTYLGIRVCRIYFCVVGSTVGSPYM